MASGVNSQLNCPKEREETQAGVACTGGWTALMFAAGKGYEKIVQAWLPDGYSQIFRLYVFGPSGLKDYGSTTLRCKM